MPATVPAGKLTPADDEQLWTIIEGLIEHSRSGQAAGIDEAVKQHPHLERELRELWATVLMTEDFAGRSSQLDPQKRPASAMMAEESIGLAGRLPRRFGDYELLEELGRGGMGIVYKARQLHPERIVALKMILRGDLASANDLARFRSEAEAAAQLDHPNIVPVYQVGENEGRPFYSMKLIEGTTLARKLLDGPITGRAAAEWLLPISRAIADAHRRGIIHRDLKPSNILIDRDGASYVSDFGLAKRLSLGDDQELSFPSVTGSGAIIGTPGYMAPEQAAGNRGEVSSKTDVYSLGAILYAMLTGRPPFQAASPLDTVLMVLEQEPLPPRLINPKADSDLEMIALKCLQKPIDLRYASADDLADDLRAYLANEPIAARSSQFVKVISRAFRETHHAAILENWGILWMWHSLVVLALCIITNWMHIEGVSSRWPYMGLWSVGVGIWAFIFWELRRRSGPITFVERQIAHVWAGSTIASTLLYFIEWILNLPVLALSPVLGLLAGTVFLSKAGILSGKFYLQAAALYASAFIMAYLEAQKWPFGLTCYGFVLAACFFLPGLKYYRQRANDQFDRAR
jgi:eukaryotic-like serine/threonine-protein kinase